MIEQNAGCGCTCAVKNWFVQLCSAYGIAEEHQGRGYATEAVTAAVSWALQQNAVSCVTAEVDKDNIASIRVLEKSGFELTGRIGEEGPIYRKVNDPAN